MAKKLNGILYVLLYIAIYFLAQLIAVAAQPLSDTLLYIINGERDLMRLTRHFINQIEGQKIDTVYILLASMVITIGVIWIIISARKKKLSFYIKSRKLNLKEITAAVFFAYGLNVLASYITSLPSLAKFQGDYGRAMEEIVMGDLASMLIVVGLIAPAFEEIFFRGIIFGELKNCGGFMFSNAIQSVLFGIMHLNVIQGLYAAVIGFIFGIMYNISGSIYLTILTHILFNASNILVSDYMRIATAMPYYLISGAVALLFGFLLISKGKA